MPDDDALDSSSVTRSPHIVREVPNHVLGSVISYVVAMILTALIAIVATYIAMNRAPVVTAIAIGTIDTPTAGSTVGSTIRLKGTLTLPDDHYAFAIVEVRDEVNTLLYFPKEGFIRANKDGEWEHEIYEDGPLNDKEFSIGLWVANELGYEHVIEWHRKGNAAGSYNAMRDTTGLRRLCRIDKLAVSE